MGKNFDPGAGEPLADGPFVAGMDADGYLRPDAAIDIAGTMFREAAEDLHRLRIGIRKGNVKDGLETGKAVRDLRAATALVQEERTRLDKLRKEIAGGAGFGQLDLDAARDEIGRRLACLRRARGD